jgi:hypothetical protein
MAGGWSTVSLNVCFATAPIPLLALKVKLYALDLAAPVAGAPLRVAVPSPLLINVTPLGRAPLSVRVAAGKPVEANMKLFDWPTTKIALPALVIEGAWSTFRTKF